MIKNASLSPVFYYLEDGQLYPGTEEDFKKLTGALWATDLKGDLTAPFVNLCPSLSDLELSPVLLPPYESFRKCPPPLYLKKGKKSGLNTLHAWNEIPKGAIVTEYLGEWEPEPTSTSSYRWGPINGLHSRNLGGMIDDGFPNVAPFYLFDTCGAPLRVIFVAIETIPAKSIITTDYGMGHSVKVGCHIEYRKEKLLTHFSRDSLKGMAKTARNDISEKKRVLSLKQAATIEEKKAKLQYLFHTPSALLTLMLENVLKVREVFDFYDKIDNRLYLLGFYSAKNSREKEIGRFIEILRKYFSGNRPFDSTIGKLQDLVRVQVLFDAFITPVLEDGDAETHFKEAQNVDLAIDALCQGDIDLFDLCYRQSVRKDALLKICSIFKKVPTDPSLSSI